MIFVCMHATTVQRLKYLISVQLNVPVHHVCPQPQERRLLVFWEGAHFDVFMCVCYLIFRNIRSPIKVLKSDSLCLC